MVNQKHTKDSLIEDFIFDIKSLVKKIEENKAINSDYAKFQEMIELLGVPTEDILKTLKQYGFDGWGDFYVARQSSSRLDYLRTQPVLGSIQGMSNAAIHALNKMLSS